MILNRPADLLTNKFYRNLPRLPLGIDQSQLPELLRFDLFDLVGLLPITTEVSAAAGGFLDVTPSQDVIRYYEEQRISFAMISIVANCYDFQVVDDVVMGRPYSITLFPASKRGSVDYVSARSLSLFKMEDLPSHDYVYYGFDPFEGARGVFAPYGFCADGEAVDGLFTDSIGFVIGTYFLANSFNSETLAMTDLHSASAPVRKRYRRWRARRYFSQFTDLRPRRVWGAESPLELFLLQRLARSGIHGVPQYLFFSNGEMYPSFHDMVSDDSCASESPIITEADIYFPEQKVAVFCDSKHYHRLGTAREKDQLITTKLTNLGIKCVRVPSEFIFGNTERAVEMVKQAVE